MRESSNLTTLSHPIMAIDFGYSRVGVAMTDLAGLMSHPLKTVCSKKQRHLEELLELIDLYKVKRVLIGLPLSLNGSQNVMTQQVKAFGKTLEKSIHPLPLHYVDERFSTEIAKEKFYESGKKGRTIKNHIDQLAAVEILDYWLQTGSSIDP